MSRVHLWILWLLTLILTVAPDAVAGTNSNACMALHVGPAVNKAPCENGPVSVYQFDTAGFLFPPNVYFTYVFIGDYSVICGVAGGRVGIATEGGVALWEWHSCAVTETPTTDPAWPDSGSGIEWSWDATSNDQILGCHLTNRPAIVGYFYMGAYDPGGRIVLTRHPVDGRASVVSCYAVTDTICGHGSITSPCMGVTHLGGVAFNAFGTGGFHACGYDIIHPTDGANRAGTCTAPTRSITWGAVKGLYR